MKQRLKRILAKRPRRHKPPEESLEQAIQNIPRITNETVAEHREEVLGSARKYIYPLQHSAHRVVIISGVLFAVVLVSFLAYCLLALYKVQSSSTFIYRVTQVVPFPVAKAGPHFVAYENYLFELRHYIRYYETQQKVDFGSNCQASDAQQSNKKCGKQQLTDFRRKALQLVVENAYIKQLAKQHNISVSDQELNNEITLVRNQNRLGSNDQVFADVLKEFWGWSVDDFKRELRQQMLAQKVIAALDVDTQSRAQNVYKQLQDTGKFTELAKQYSDDVNTKDNGGDYGILIDRTNRDLAPQVIDAIFKLKPDGYSGLITTPVGIEVVKLKEMDGNKARAAHIVFAFKNVSTYTDPLRATEKPQLYIHP